MTIHLLLFQESECDSGYIEIWLQPAWQVGKPCRKEWDKLWNYRTGF